MVSFGDSEGGAPIFSVNYGLIASFPLPGTESGVVPGNGTLGLIDNPSHGDGHTLVFCDAHVEYIGAWRLYDPKTHSGLRRWNYDNEPH